MKVLQVAGFRLAHPVQGWALGKLTEAQALHRVFLPAARLGDQDSSSVMSSSLDKSGLQCFDAPFQLFMLKRLLRELDDALGRPDANVLPIAVEMLYESFRCFGCVGLDTVQRTL